MKAFFEDISREWRGKVASARYAYSSRNSRYWLRGSIVRMNREASAITGYVLARPTVLLLTIALIGFATIASLSIPHEEILQVLGVFAEMMVGFISLLVAAAIFISTLRRQSDDKSTAQDLKFMNALRKNKGLIKQVYIKYCDKLSRAERLAVFKATPADSILDYSDYPAYKNWHQENINSLDYDDMEYYYEYVKYPPNIVTNMGYSRSYLITDALSVAKRYVEKDTKASSRLRESIDNLYEAANVYQAAGVGGYYVPVEFVGQRLYRVVVYSLMALLLFVVALVGGAWQADIFPGINLYTPIVATALAIFSMGIAIVVIVRYVAMFLNYLRESSTYNTSLLTVYVDEPDPAMYQPNSHPPLG